MGHSCTPDAATAACRVLVVAFERETHEVAYSQPAAAFPMTQLHPALLTCILHIAVAVQQAAQQPQRVLRVGVAAPDDSLNILKAALHTPKQQRQVRWAAGVSPFLKKRKNQK